MTQKRPSTLATYLTQLQARGEIVFSAARAQQDLAISKGALLDAAEKLQKRGHLISPRRGFYVIVPPQFLSWGAPPPSWYIDRLMQHEQRPYYVGLLKAAELHGATHHAVTEFQVITSTQLRAIRAGRSEIVFYYRKDIRKVAAGVQQHKTDTGTMKISSRELTALDLVRYTQAGGGYDHLATVLSDLAGEIDPPKLASLSKAFERSIVQRLGYLLETLGFSRQATQLHDNLVHQVSQLPWVELDPAQASDPDFAPAPTARDERWRVVVRRAPERDE